MKNTRVHFARQYEVTIGWDNRSPHYFADIIRSVMDTHTTILGVLVDRQIQHSYQYPYREVFTGSQEDSPVTFFDYLVRRIVMMSLLFPNYLELNINERNGYESILTVNHPMHRWRDLLSSFVCSRSGEQTVSQRTDANEPSVNTGNTGQQTDPIPGIYLFSQRMENEFNNLVSSNPATPRVAQFTDAIGFDRGGLQTPVSQQQLMSYSPQTRLIRTENIESSTNNMGMQFHISATGEIDFFTIADPSRQHMTLTFRAINENSDKFVRLTNDHRPTDDDNDPNSDRWFVKNAFDFSICLGIAAKLFIRSHKKS